MRRSSCTCKEARMGRDWRMGKSEGTRGNSVGVSTVGHYKSLGGGRVGGESELKRSVNQEGNVLEGWTDLLSRSS